MLKIIDLKNDKISGVTSPWVYMGMKFASFCWHVEDLFINSLNYNHFGATKTWYIIPGEEKEKFDRYVEQKYPKEIEAKPDFLHRITLMIDPMELMANGVKVYKIQQNARCYVLTFSKVYHAGFSHGFNVGEAVNFVSPISYPYIK
jgi:histone demethylase JARID1